MSEKTQDPTQGTSGPQEGPTITPAPPLSPVTPGLNPDTYADDGKTWKSKYHGIVGRLKVVEGKRDTEIGERDQKIADAQQLILEHEAKITALGADVTRLTGEVQTIPQLQGELAAASEGAKKAGKLEILMQYPALLTMQVEEEQQVEGQEEPIKVQVNPFMRLIEATTLAGDDLAQELQRLVSVLPSTTPAVATPVVEGAAPQPAQPAGTGDVDALRATALDWHKKTIAGEPGAKEKEYEAWTALYKAQSSERTNK